MEPTTTTQPTPQSHDHSGSRITITGALALFAARVLMLPPGEYLIALDTRIAHKPQWKVSTAGPWERPRREEL